MPAHHGEQRERTQPQCNRYEAVQNLHHGVKHQREICAAEKSIANEVGERDVARGISYEGDRSDRQSDRGAAFDCLGRSRCFRRQFRRLSQRSDEPNQKQHPAEHLR